MTKNLLLKTAALSAALFLIGHVADAQTLFTKDTRVAGLGIGLGDFLGGAGYNHSLPIAVSLDYGILDDLFDEKSSLGIGGYLAYASNKQTWLADGVAYGYKYSHFIFGARGTLHYQFDVDNLDTYGGLMLGYDAMSANSFGSLGAQRASASSGDVVLSLFVGARYYFTDRFAAFAELGYGIAALQIGVSMKF